MKLFKRFTPFILIAIVVLFSLGKTLQYYFYTDDYALLYYIQHNYSYGWPYAYITAFFTPFYKFFGLWTEAYFALGIFTFFIASLGVYFFIKVLTKNKLVAFFSSLIFATGYIGIDQFTMMSVSSINNLNIINVSLTLILFILWLDKRKLKFYLATIFMFWVSTSAFPFRAFPLLLFLPTIELILSFKLGKPSVILKKLALIGIRFMPFLLIAYSNGIFSYGVKENASLDVNQFSILKAILNLITPEFLKEIFAILGRFIFLNPQGPYFQIGLLFFLTSLFIGFYFCFSKYSRLGKSLLIVLFMTTQGYIGNMILLPDFDSNGPVNRYLTIAFIGYSSIFPIFTFLLVKRLAFLTKINRLTILVPFLIIPLVTIMSISSRKYEENILRERSVPAREFFNQLKSLVPKLSAKSIFYFDVSDVYPFPSRYGSVVLGAVMPKEVVLASYYGVDINSIKIIDKFNEFIRFVKNKDSKTNFYTFYYDREGLSKTNDELFLLLQNGRSEQIDLNKIIYSTNNLIPRIDIPVKNFSSLTPSKIELQLSIKPVSDSEFSFPFYNSINNKKEVKDFYEKILDRSIFFDYLLSRKRYYDKVKVEVSSSHVAGNNPGELLIDDDKETSWLSDESAWQIGIRPWIKIDFGEERKISRLTWIKLSNRVMSDYQISVSSDGISWQEVKARHIFDYNKERVIEEFSSVIARFIMIKVNKTLNNFTPGLSEIEAIDYNYKDIDIAKALRIKDNPFEYIKDAKDLEKTYDYLSHNAVLNFLTKTNKDENITNSYLLKVPIVLDGQYQNYQLYLPPRGTNLEKIMIELNFPAIIKIGRLEIIHPSLREIEL